MIETSDDMDSDAEATTGSSTVLTGEISAGKSSKANRVRGSAI
jgi:hypothetical protein